MEAETPVPIEWVTRVPLWVVQLHRINRLGLADAYAPSGRFTKIIVTPIIEAKFPALRDMDCVMIIYKDKGL